MRPFQEYRVGALAHELTLAVYRATATFPREEQWGLVSQMRRSAAAIPTNIAEGSAHGDVEFHRFLRIALGSAAELEYQLLLSRDLGLLSADAYEALNTQTGTVKRMLITFMSRLVPSSARTRRTTPGANAPTANGQRPSAPRQAEP